MTSPRRCWTPSSVASASASERARAAEQAALRVRACVKETKLKAAARADRPLRDALPLVCRNAVDGRPVRANEAQSDFPAPPACEGGAGAAGMLGCRPPATPVPSALPGAFSDVRAAPTGAQPHSCLYCSFRCTPQLRPTAVGGGPFGCTLSRGHSFSCSPTCRHAISPWAAPQCLSAAAARARRPARRQPGPAAGRRRP
jgi:hypothetical protein